MLAKGGRKRYGYWQNQSSKEAVMNDGELPKRRKIFIDKAVSI